MKFEDLTLDERQKLAQTDPEQFDKLAKQAIADLIETVGDPKKRWALKKLQNDVNKDLKKYKNPIARYNRMVELFYDQFNKFNQSLEPFRKQ